MCVCACMTPAANACRGVLWRCGRCGVFGFQCVPTPLPPTHPSHPPHPPGLHRLPPRQNSPNPRSSAQAAASTQGRVLICRPPLPPLWTLASSALPRHEGLMAQHPARPSPVQVGIPRHWGVGAPPAALVWGTVESEDIGHDTGAVQPHSCRFLFFPKLSQNSRPPPHSSLPCAPCLPGSFPTAASVEEAGVRCIGSPGAPMAQQITALSRLRTLAESALALGSGPRPTRGSLEGTKPSSTAVDASPSSPASVVGRLSVVHAPALLLLSEVR